MNENWLESTQGRIQRQTDLEVSGRQTRVKREPPSAAPRGRTGRGPICKTSLNLRPRSPAARHDCESPVRNKSCDRYSSDPETGVAPGVTQGRNVRSRCRCSMCPAIHINSRSWLRSSSTHEPSDPPLRVVFCSREAIVSPLRPGNGRTSDGRDESQKAIQQ